MAPTSVGIALKLLMETKMIDEFFAQLIIAAAFLDDILSLVAFSLLFSIGETGKLTFKEGILPAVMGFTFLLSAGYLAACACPDWMYFFYF